VLVLVLVLESYSDPAAPMTTFFFHVKTPTEARRLLNRETYVPKVETLPLAAARGRVCARPIAAPHDLPEFNRSVVDGYAVRAADTFGASPGLPAYLTVAGEVLMGQETTLDLGPTQAARIATGGMLPEGADAVVMIEYTDSPVEGTVEVTRPAAPGEHVVRRGDDVLAGEPLIPAGRRLRPHDLGALAGLGILTVDVFARPRVALLPTGDEIVPPDAAPGPGQVRDVNTTALAAAVEAAGGIPLPLTIVPDQLDRLRAALAHAIAGSELVLISGGSSVGARDGTLDALLSFPDSELLLHGIAIRPGKPVIAVRIGARLLFGLPGNPVSALVVFDQFVQPHLRRLAGEGVQAFRRSGVQDDSSETPNARTPERLNAFPLLPTTPTVEARLATNVASEAGKEDYVRVRLRCDGAGYLAEPVLGKSALIATMVEADGMVIIPEGVEGLEAGVRVPVVLF
jgi:molybdopterin molybdotransferase